MRKILLAELFCMLAITVQAQFVTITLDLHPRITDKIEKINL